MDGGNVQEMEQKLGRIEADKRTVPLIGINTVIFVYELIFG